MSACGMSWSAKADQPPTSLKWPREGSAYDDGVYRLTKPMTFIAMRVQALSCCKHVFGRSVAVWIALLDRLAGSCQPIITRSYPGRAGERLAFARAA